VEDILKICSKCKVNAKKEAQSYCVDCISTYQKERYLAKKEEIIKKQKEYISKNKNSILLKNKIYKSKNADKCKQLTKDWKRNNFHKVLSFNAKRRANLRNAIPTWLSDNDIWMIEQAYDIAQKRNQVFSFKWHVDHVIPLKGKTVCGLHTPYNLQVIPAKDNLIKANDFLTT
jgi:hypothetical protein